MYELRVTVAEILGHCPARQVVKVGDTFAVRNGDLCIPGDDQRICLWALQSIMSLLPARECAIVEKGDGKWARQTHHVQCPDPDGKVIFRVERRERLAHAA
jgi:carbon-monoxide dehydrogenase iron sulfur subunit